MFTKKQNILEYIVNEKINFILNLFIEIKKNYKCKLIKSKEEDKLIEEYFMKVCCKLNQIWIYTLIWQPESLKLI